MLHKKNEELWSPHHVPHSKKNGTLLPSPSFLDTTLFSLFLIPFTHITHHIQLLSKTSIMRTSTTMANLTVTIVLIIAVASMISGAAAYTNHTVGGVAGWHFNSTTNISAFNYSSWVASQTFSLGDFLVFNTISNQTVIQTYNETTYRSCTMDDAEDDDTFQFFGGTTEFDKELTVAVPLTIEGPNYYFSDADDGVQCQHGMAFEVNVSHGQGLPPSLSQPPPPPYVEPPSSDPLSPPVTVTGELPKSESGGRLRICAIVRVMIYALPLLLVV